MARGLPARPPVPVLAGILLEASDDGTLTLSAFDYEVSARVTVAADVAESGTVLVLGRLLADISRNLPGPPDRRRDRGQQGPGDVRRVPLQPADDAGRRLPDAAVLPGADRLGRRPPLHPGGRPGLGRGRPRRHPADPHRRPGRGRGRHDDAPRDRPLPPRDARADVEPHGHRRQPRRPHPGAHALRDRPQPRRERLDRRRPRRQPPVATGSSASRPGAAARRPASSTASTPRSPRSSRRPPTPRPSCGPPTSSRPSSASPSSPSATPRSGSASATARSPSRPAPATTPRRPRPSSATLTGPEVEIAFNPTLPARRARRGRHRLEPHLLHPALAPGGALRPGRAPTARPTPRTGTSSCRCASPPDRTRPGPKRPRRSAVACGETHTDTSHEGADGCSSDWSASARWAATCASACAAPGHEVVGYDRNKQVSDATSLADMVKKLDGPRVVWVMVPHGEPTRDTVAELADLLDKGDLVIDGGNSKFTDDIENEKLLKAQGHRLRRLRCLRRHLGSRERLRPDGRRHQGQRPQGDADLRRAAARGPARRGLRPRRQGRRRPLHEDGAQRHRVRPDGTRTPRATSCS